MSDRHPKACIATSGIMKDGQQGGTSLVSAYLISPCPVTQVSSATESYHQVPVGNQEQMTISYISLGFSETPLNSTGPPS